MPSLTIDNQSVTVPSGRSVLEAAQQLGIAVPHFCYHEALGAVGSCRLCAVKFEEGPVMGVKMSCMVEAQDGMVVSTVDPESTELRQSVIEWLMINHPHDCPVCDEGGECLLQEMTVAGGHSIRRYRGKKRTYQNQDLGPFVEQEMNRCIQCYRCVRTYQDYCGGDDFGTMGSRNRVFFGRFRPGRLRSPYSGNLIDVCPTGVFTDKTFRFKSRYWDLQEAPSICPHCSLGCAAIPGARYREVQRVRSGINRRVNSFFICDRGRFGYGHANIEQRPRNPRIDGREAGWTEALAELKGRVEELLAKEGPQSVAFLGSSRACLEANYLLRVWAEKLGCDRIAFECHPGRDGAARQAAARQEENSCSLEDLRNSDFVLLVGADPVAEGPMLGPAVRQAVRAGAKAAVIDPRNIELPFEASRLPLAPEKLQAALIALRDEDYRDFSRQEASFLAGTAERLRKAEKPVIAGGGDLLGEKGTRELLETARSLSCRAFPLLGGPNSFGGALLSRGPDFDSTLEGILRGRIKALICLETDPCGDHPEPGRVLAEMERLELLAVLDAVPTETGRRADILLPTTVVAETEGVFVNNEGRMLSFEAVLEPGIPIRETGGGAHPPRIFQEDTPGSLPRPAREILAALVGGETSLADLRRQIEEEDSRFTGLSELAAGSEGRRVAGTGAPTAEPSAPDSAAPSGELRLLVTESLFGSEILSSLSPPTAEAAPSPHVFLHALDGKRLGFQEGEEARLATPIGHFSVKVRLSERMARGLVVVPRLRGTPLGLLVPGGPPAACTLEKGGAG